MFGVLRFIKNLFRAKSKAKINLEGIIRNNMRDIKVVEQLMKNVNNWTGYDQYIYDKTVERIKRRTTFGLTLVKRIENGH